MQHSKQAEEVRADEEDETEEHNMFGHYITLSIFLGINDEK